MQTTLFLLVSSALIIGLYAPGTAAGAEPGWRMLFKNAQPLQNVPQMASSRLVAGVLHVTIKNAGDTRISRARANPAPVKEGM